MSDGMGISTLLQDGPIGKEFSPEAVSWTMNSLHNLVRTHCLWVTQLRQVWCTCIATLTGAGLR